jgi:hypothetical protein
MAELVAGTERRSISLKPSRSRSWSAVSKRIMRPAGRRSRKAVSDKALSDRTARTVMQSAAAADEARRPRIWLLRRQSPRVPNFYDFTQERAFSRTGFHHGEARCGINHFERDRRRPAARAKVKPCHRRWGISDAAIRGSTIRRSMLCEGEPSSGMDVRFIREFQRSRRRQYSSSSPI